MPAAAARHGGGLEPQARPAAPQAHPFFEGVDWERLPHQAPPYAPRVEHALDTQNFERFDEEAGPAGGSGGKRWARADPNFIGYTYKNWEAVASPSGARARPFPRRHPCGSGAPPLAGLARERRSAPWPRRSLCAGGARSHGTTLKSPCMGMLRPAERAQERRRGR